MPPHSRLYLPLQARSRYCGVNLSAGTTVGHPSQETKAVEGLDRASLAAAARGSTLAANGGGLARAATVPNCLAIAAKPGCAADEGVRSSECSGDGDESNARSSSGNKADALEEPEPTAVRVLKMTASASADTWEAAIRAPTPPPGQLGAPCSGASLPLAEPNQPWNLPNPHHSDAWPKRPSLLSLGTGRRSSRKASRRSERSSGSVNGSADLMCTSPPALPAAAKGAPALPSSLADMPTEYLMSVPRSSPECLAQHAHELPPRYFGGSPMASHMAPPPETLEALQALATELQAKLALLSPWINEGRSDSITRAAA